MNFDEYLVLAKGEKPFQIEQDWAQGRTTFGGMSAALVMAKMLNTDLPHKLVRSANISFCGPVLIDKDCDISVSITSQGKSVAHVFGQLTQDGQVVTQVTACLANDRESQFVWPAPSVENFKPASGGQQMPYIKGLTPEFIQHIDMSIVEGGLPFSGQSSSNLQGWAAFKEAPASIEVPHVLALVDAWPPIILNMLKRMVPSSSVTWSIEFIHPAPTISGDQGLYYDCDLEQAENGYGHTHARIYHPNGQLMVLSRQLVAVYDKR